ncbi:hypothetical protein BDW68DRAFT_191774 [Aspergillus falconensis]
MAAVLQSQKIALITGAVSGIGFAVAKLCRSRGMHLALLDIDAVNLPKAKEVPESALTDSSLKTEAYTMMWRQSSFKTLDLVSLNAARGTKPESDPKAIIITDAKQGITNPPGAHNPAYNSSKGAIKILTEHLAHDLRSESTTAHISAHLLVLGRTWTGLMGNVGPTDAKEVKIMKGSWAPSQRGPFYIICSDEDVDQALDQTRMLWGCEDILEDRPALSRWEEGWKRRAEQAIREDAERRRK